MKKLIVCIFSLMALAACGHSSNSTASAPTGDVSTLGDPNAPPGHRYPNQCSSDFLQDYQNLENCSLGQTGGNPWDQDNGNDHHHDQNNDCQNVSNNFDAKYRNYACSYDYGDGRTIDYAHSESHSWNNANNDSWQ